MRGGSRGTGGYFCLSWGGGVRSVSGRLWGAGGAQVHSHGQELAHPRPAPWGTGGTARQGTALLFPTRSGTNARMGKQAAAGQAGVCFAGLQSHDLNFLSSLLSLHLTHADPLTPPGLHRSPTSLSILFLAGLGSIHKRLSSLQGNTSCFEDGRQQLYSQELGTTRALPSSNPSPRL